MADEQQPKDTPEGTSPLVANEVTDDDKPIVEQEVAGTPTGEQPAHPEAPTETPAAEAPVAEAPPAEETPAAIPPPLDTGDQQRLRQLEEQNAQYQQREQEAQIKLAADQYKQQLVNQGWAEDQAQAYSQLQAQNAILERLTAEAIYLAVGLSRSWQGEYWPLVVGVHVVPDYDMVVGSEV